jgi:hypothetical protein
MLRHIFQLHAEDLSLEGTPKLGFLFNVPPSMSIQVNNKIALLSCETILYTRNCDHNLNAQIFTHRKKNTETITSLRETIEYTETRLNVRNQKQTSVLTGKK